MKVGVDGGRLLCVVSVWLTVLLVVAGGTTVYRNTVTDEVSQTRPGEADGRVAAGDPRLALDLSAVGPGAMTAAGAAAQQQELAATQDAEPTTAQREREVEKEV